MAQYQSYLEDRQKIGKRIGKFRSDNNKLNNLKIQRFNGLKLRWIFFFFSFVHNAMRFNHVSFFISPFNDRTKFYSERFYS